MPTGAAIWTTTVYQSQSRSYYLVATANAQVENHGGLIHFLKKLKN